MAVTHGHGNPKWTRDETILALDLYLDCSDRIPSSSDPRVKSLSNLLRAFPYNRNVARKASFRNPDGVSFKLQNLRQVATGKGLGNVSKMDRAIWKEFKNDPDRVKIFADLIRKGIRACEIEQEEPEEEEFVEGRVVTETHKRRERNSRLRRKLIEQRKHSDSLKCELCNLEPGLSEFSEAIFEAHHLLPIAASVERVTKLKDMALLCANCHRMIHRAIAKGKKWLDIKEAKHIIMGTAKMIP